MEVVELELERTGSLQEYEMKCKAMQNQLMEQEEAANDHQSMLVVQVNQLKEQIEAVSIDLIHYTWNACSYIHRRRSASLSKKTGTLLWKRKYIIISLNLKRTKTPLKMKWLIDFIMKLQRTNRE